MKILFAGDASNMHNCLAQQLRKMGHEATVASDGSRWMDTHRDIDLKRRPGKIGALRYFPLLRELPPRGKTAEAVSAEDLAAVDAREAVTEEQKKAAAAMTGVVAKTASGKELFIRDNAAEPRKLPTFENALEPKPQPPDESDAYSKPVEQKTRFEEWKPEA